MSILTLGKIHEDVTIKFASLDLDFDEETRFHGDPDLQKTIFFEMSEDLYVTYMNACGGAVPFKDMENQFYRNRRQIHKVSADLCMWQYNLCWSSSNRLRDFMCLYPEYDGLAELEHQKYESIIEQVRFDAIETLAFLCAKINEVALKQRCLGIFGI